MENNHKMPGLIIIYGETQEGRKFRPSDWAERLLGSVSSYGPGRRMLKQPFVRIINLEGIKCVRIDPGLFQEDPVKYRFLMRFAHDNNLKTEGSLQVKDTSLEV